MNERKAMPDSIMSHQEWIRGVGGVHAVEKNQQLLAIDEVFYAYTSKVGLRDGRGRAPVVYRSNAMRDDRSEKQLLGALHDALAKWYASAPTKDGKTLELYKQTLKAYNPSNPDLPPLSALEMELQQARLGVLYLFSNLNVRVLCAEEVAGILFNSVKLALLETHDIEAVDAPFLRAGMSSAATEFVKDKMKEVATTGGGIAEKAIRSNVLSKDDVEYSRFEAVLRAAIYKIWRTVVNFMEGARDKFVSVIGGYWEDPNELIALVVEVLMNQYLPAIIPLYATTKALINDIGGLLQDSVDALIQYIQKRSVAFSEWGASIIDGVHRGNAWMLGNKIVKTISDSVSLALIVAGGPAGSAARKVKNVVVAMAMGIAKICYRTWECRRLQAFCREAKLRYTKSGLSSGQVSQANAALSIDVKRFDEWFFSCARSVPAIAALTLSSRICGGKYVQLRMSDGGRDIRGSEYDRGSSYMNYLASIAQRYIKQSGLNPSFGNEQLNAIMSSWNSVVAKFSVPPGGFQINPKFAKTDVTIGTRELAGYRALR
ncbi:hypothetical protein [Trinickia fusca]|uniref:Uncharacterized protein n=1 Tax=Trinickia fusca TaxID=2419777 RepID=A0A494XL62_9BURK|nr:hypothetical protein [Trinickia fusca]RKP49396.1 hypothetical protein D7S89_11580 [Trinickia fusca]